MNKRLEQLQSQWEARTQNNIPLNHGDGGGTFDDMEARVAALEEIAKDTRGTLESIQRQLARMDAKLDGKPDQGWIINLVCIIFGLVLAAVAASAGIFALIK